MNLLRRMYPARVGLAILLLTGGTGLGCLSPAYHNAELKTPRPNEGYRFDALKLGLGNTDDLFVCLTFSGGGTRAAALAYGVLLKLNNTELSPGSFLPLDPHSPRALPTLTNRCRANARSLVSSEKNAMALDHKGRNTSLLDEVDIISSVSGGSFTAAAYALWREKLFHSRFQAKFLYNNIQGVLLRTLLKPLNFLLLPYVFLDRIDLAAMYYDQAIFDHGNYADLVTRSTRPLVVLNATNLAIGQRFAFTQDDFDVLGSDLASVPIAWAVAASSAFPILLSPLRLRYYKNDNSTTAIRAAQASRDNTRRNRRLYRWTNSLLAPPVNGQPPQLLLDAAQHKYLYLVDGGLSDNLGLSQIIQSYRWGAIRRRLDQQRIQRLVVIIVDAGRRPPQDMERRSASPGLLDVGFKTGVTSMNNFSAALIDTMKYLMIDEPQQAREAAARCQSSLDKQCPDTAVDAPLFADNVERYLIVLNFDEIKDHKTRRRFLALPTNFFLPRQDVDCLIDMAGKLLEQHAEFQRLVRDLRANQAP